MKLLNYIPVRRARLTGEFFKPLRRKTGVLILLLIPLLLVGWVRSLFVQDTFEIWCGKHALMKVVSASHRLMVVAIELGNAEPTPGPFWISTQVSDQKWEMELLLANSSRAIVRNTLPKHVSTSDRIPLNVGNSTIFVTLYQVRYWLVLAPLLILSAGLLIFGTSGVEQPQQLVAPKPYSPPKRRKKRR
jgi:hypothetical protein